MLNSISSSSSTVNQSINFNAVSGTMFKSCEGSFFSRFHLKSGNSESLLSENPCFRRYGRDIPAVVLQTMIVGDMEVIAEIIEKEKYEQLMKGGTE